MKTVSSQIIYNSIVFNGPKPVECPHCGAYVSPVIRFISGLNYSSSKFIYLVVFRGNCCDKDFFALYDVDQKSGKLLSIYPNHQCANLPKAIEIISPRFVELYNQCYIAEQNGHLELAGSGYRNAIEVLVKDYAINELKHPRDEVIHKKLAASIKAYLPSIDLKQSADVIRILGNDYTHYDQIYSDNTFSILKQYIEIFIKSIETAYLIKHPKIKTQFDETE